jgi:hypothetical protein
MSYGDLRAVAGVGGYGVAERQWPLGFLVRGQGRDSGSEQGGDRTAHLVSISAASKRVLTLPSVLIVLGLTWTT